MSNASKYSVHYAAVLINPGCPACMILFQLIPSGRIACTYVYMPYITCLHFAHSGSPSPCSYPSTETGLWPRSAELGLPWPCQWPIVPSGSKTDSGPRDPTARNRSYSGVPSCALCYRDTLRACEPQHCARATSSPNLESCLDGDSRSCGGKGDGYFEPAVVVTSRMQPTWCFTKYIFSTCRY